MSDQPSEAALEAAGEFAYVEWDSGAPPDDPEEYDILNFYVGEMGIFFEDNDEARDAHQKMTTDLAQRFDTFAAQAVAAERARIVGELREKLIRSRELLEMGHEFASEYVTAFSTAIAIAEGEP